MSDDTFKGWCPERGETEADAIECGEYRDNFRLIEALHRFAKDRFDIEPFTKITVRMRQPGGRLVEATIVVEDRPTFFVHRTQDIKEPGA